MMVQLPICERGLDAENTKFRVVLVGISCQIDKIGRRIRRASPNQDRTRRALYLSIRLRDRERVCGE